MKFWVAALGVFATLTLTGCVYSLSEDRPTQEVPTEPSAVERGPQYQLDRIEEVQVELSDGTVATCLIYYNTSMHCFDPKSR